jgi:S-sulfosulfanyl-L-cysteine sulfohydrolase
MSNRRGFIKNVTTLSAATLLPKVDIPIAEDVENAGDIAIAQKKKITILQTTDVHCQIHPHDELFWENEKAVFRKTGGYAHIAAYFDKIKKENPHTFLIDTGDMFQGSALSVKTTGDAYVPILNALNYNLFLPGNWEVVYGKRKMQNLLGGLMAPKICSNMYHDIGEGKKGELIFQPYYTWAVEGVKIGFLGYTDHLVPIRQSPSYTKGIVYTKPEENVTYYIDVLKQQEQCDFIIIIAHIGLSQQIALANSDLCVGLDYILGGDTHERVRKPIQCKHAKVVEPGAFGSFVGKLELTVENGKITKDDYTLVEINDKIKPNKQIQKLVEAQEAQYKPSISKIIGYSTIPLYRYFVVENPIDTMILEALHWKFPNIDIVMSNGFRFCPPLTTPDHTGNIPITEGFLFDMLPVDSPIRTATTTGKKLKAWLEKELNNVFANEAANRFGGWVVKFKGMEITFNAYGNNNERLQSITINNQPLIDDQSYTILACEREGDPEDMLCRMKGVTNAKNTSSTLHSAIKEYLTASSPISPSPKGQAKILDAPATLLSQVSGVDYVFR